MVYSKKLNADKARSDDKRLFKMQCLHFDAAVFFLFLARAIYESFMFCYSCFFLQHVFAAVFFNRREVLYRINRVMQFHRLMLLIATVVSSAELLIASYFSRKSLPRSTRIDILHNYLCVS